MKNMTKILFPVPILTSLFTIIVTESYASEASLADNNPKLIFQEDFEEQPQWNSALHSTDRGQTIGNHTIPNNWTAVRQDPARAPSKGFPDHHETIYIGEQTPEKVHTGLKSAVFYRDAMDEPAWKWWSDGIIAKFFDNDYQSLYIEFYLKFSPREGFEPLSNSKIFRVTSWDKTGAPTIEDTYFNYFRDGTNAPLFTWLYGLNTYGPRNHLAFRGAPAASNYYFEEKPVPDLPRPMIDGDISLNFYDNVRDQNSDGTLDIQKYSIVDQTTTDNLVLDSNPTSHEQVWGSEWHKLGFYLKMNSEPGSTDGRFVQWLDDQIVYANIHIPWYGPSADPSEMRGWNGVKFGGNDFIKSPEADALQYEDWYAIDDIRVLDGLTDSLAESIRTYLPSDRRPFPEGPSGINISK